MDNNKNTCKNKVDSTRAVSCTVRFSNIGGGNGSLPELKNAITVIGQMVNNVYMVKLNDLADILGASLNITGNDWRISRNGQDITFQNNSSTMTASISYQYYDPSLNTSVSKSHVWTAFLPVPAQAISSSDNRYVPLEITAMQLGALIVGVVSSDNIITVFDFRVNQRYSALADSNKYIVGGSWLNNWSNSQNIQLSTHFMIHELCDPNNKQLKFAVATLESLERVRYFYNNNSSLTVAGAFRGWLRNQSIPGWEYSFHMRGRAFDIDSAHNGTALYNCVYNEFGEPQIINWAFYRTLNELTGNSRGYEIETMPRRDETGALVTWLHLQNKPGYNVAEECP